MRYARRNNARQFRRPIEWRSESTQGVRRTGDGGLGADDRSGGDMNAGVQEMLYGWRTGSTGQRFSPDRADENLPKTTRRFANSPPSFDRWKIGHGSVGRALAHPFTASWWQKGAADRGRRDPITPSEAISFSQEERESEPQQSILRTTWTRRRCLWLCRPRRPSICAVSIENLARLISGRLRCRRRS